jgi:hypothetical protein
MVSIFGKARPLDSETPKRENVILTGAPSLPIIVFSSNWQIAQRLLGHVGCPMVKSIESSVPKTVRRKFL